MLMSHTSDAIGQGDRIFIREPLIVIIESVLDYWNSIMIVLIDSLHLFYITKKVFSLMFFSALCIL